MTTKLKVKIVPRFVADAVANSPILLSKAGAIYTFSLDVAALSASFSSQFVHVGDTIGIISASANALTVGANGATNPALNVDDSTASSATGVNIKSAAAAAGVAMSVLSSGTNESLTIDAKGTGGIKLNGTATGTVTVGPGTDASGVSGNLFYVTTNGSTNMSIRNSTSHVEGFFLAHTTNFYFGSFTSAPLVLRSNNTDAITIDTSQNATGVGSIKSSNATGGIGYATGAGGTVTQATNRTTGVTLSKVSGQITTNNASLAGGATARFTVTNTAVAAADTVRLSVQSGTTTDQTDVKVQAVGSGSFDIVVANRHASTAETGAIVINFTVFKGVTS